MIAYLTVLGVDVKVNYSFSKGWCGSREEPPEPDEYEIYSVEYDQQEYENLELDDQEFNEMLMKELEKYHSDEIDDYKISQLDDNGWY
jgi:hypothetical protein